MKEKICHKAPWIIKNVIYPYFEKYKKVFSDDIIKEIQDILSCYATDAYLGPAEYYKNIVEGCKSSYNMMRESFYKNKQFDSHSKEKLECLFYAKNALDVYWEQINNK